MANKKTVLVIGAHPDDYEIGAGMSILKKKEEGDKVISVICSYGGRGGESNLRRKEAEIAAKILGIDDLFFLGYKDTRFPELCEIINDFEGITSKVNPYLVMTHGAHDSHQDHIRVAAASRAAFRNIEQVLLYRGLNSEKEFSPHIFIQGTKEQLEKKLEAIKAHSTQVHKINPRYIEATAIFFGTQTNRDKSVIRYVEPFMTNHYII